LELAVKYRGLPKRLFSTNYPLHNLLKSYLRRGGSVEETLGMVSAMDNLLRAAGRTAAYMKSYLSSSRLIIDAKEADKMVTSLAQELLLEGKAEGRAEGKAEGRAEGRAEGKAEGRAEAVIRILRARFASLPAGVLRAFMPKLDGIANLKFRQ
jgi:hypothetical protein